MIVVGVSWWLVGGAIAAVVLGVVLAFVGLALVVAVTCDLRGEREQWQAVRERWGIEP